MKERADILLVRRGLAATRSKAQALILAGRVFAGERRVEKAGEMLPAEHELRIREQRQFVSRGGDKLAGALGALAVEVRSSVCVDVGASTGGFTDCLLQAGASRVYAVDVGRGQLAQKLRDDPRVIVMERVNARHLGRGAFSEPVDLVVVDASFIGLAKLLPAISSWLDPGGRLLALVKPQFEAGREAARRGRGVIRDPAVRDQAIAGAVASIGRAGFELVGEHDSALPGPKGNVERFVYAQRRSEPAPSDSLARPGTTRPRRVGKNS